MICQGLKQGSLLFDIQCPSCMWHRIKRVQHFLLWLVWNTAFETQLMISSSLRIAKIYEFDGLWDKKCLKHAKEEPWQLFTSISHWLRTGAYRLVALLEIAYTCKDIHFIDQISFVKSCFLHSIRSVASGLRRPSLLTCAGGHTVAFTVLHSWRVSGSAAREPFPCTHPLTPSARLVRPQVPFCKPSVWHDVLVVAKWNVATPKYGAPLPKLRKVSLKSELRLKNCCKR